jgi:hypothetical protein
MRLPEIIRTVAAALRARPASPRPAADGLFEAYTRVSPSLAAEPTNFDTLARAGAARRGPIPFSDLVERMGAKIAEDARGDAAVIEAKVATLAAAITQAATIHAARDRARHAREVGP